MKKIILSLSVAVLSVATTNAQVGVYNDIPETTLDIKSKSDNSEGTIEGLLIPRVSKNKALLMGQNTTTPVQESTMIYVNDISDYTNTNVDPKVADITENGYYFWKGTKWVKISNTPIQFYMPAILLPTSSVDLPANVSYNEGVFTVDLHQAYHTQYTAPVTKSTGATTLKTYASNELEYFVTYSDSSVYTDLTLSENGILTYKVVSNPNVTEKTFMNIVLKVK